MNTVTLSTGAGRVTLFLAAGFLTPLLTQGARAPADLELESCLSRAEVVERVEVLTGITSPDLLIVECDGERLQAVFKSVDEARRGRTRFDSGRSEINFTDSYRYERAAYLLDRELDIHRVPVAVIRDVERRNGALVQWIEGSTEIELGRQLSTQELIGLAGQKATMHLFDALILNTDRRPENWLLGQEDLRLHLIDHSRAFRSRDELPEEFVGRPVRISRHLYAELQELNEPDLTNLLDGLIDRAQIRALLSRRDLILDKISKDIETLGQDTIFSD